jgi:hypothetical protein
MVTRQTLLAVVADAILTQAVAADAILTQAAGIH